jgi:hypothetical protein
MAVGITKYVGAGSRPVIKTTDEEFNFDPTEGGTTTVTSTNTGGSGSTSGYYSYQSALEKIAADQAAASAAAERATRGAMLQGGYLTGQLNQGVPTNVSNLIDTSGTQGEEYIRNQYNALVNQLRGAYTPETNVGTGYLGAQGRTTAGYNALQNYLQANPPTAFQQAPQVPQTMASNDLAAYMGGQGVSTAPVDPTIAALNAAAGGGAQNYNRLLSTLGQLEQAGQQSRLAEQQMGRSGALSGLEQLYQTQTGGLQQQQLEALANLQANLTSQRLTAEQQAAARNQAVQDALASLLGTGYLSPTSTDPGVQNILQTIVPGYTPPAAPTVATPKTAVEQLAAIPVKASNTALNKRIDNFVAANPNATAAQIKKAFPSLGKNIK